MDQAKTKVVLVVCLAISAAPVTTSHAAQFKRLYRFPVGGRDGGFPTSSLLLGADGNFYGVTQEGGLAKAGTIFKVTPQGELTTIYTFGGPDGAYPIGGLIADSAGNVYGITEGGGSFNGNGGTIFKLALDGTETVLHNFGHSHNDGVAPSSGVIKDPAGNLYGSTQAGGKFGYGALFQLTPEGVETIIHSFNHTDGDTPNGRLLRDPDGTLYGTTQTGGQYDGGTVFEVNSKGRFAVLHNFEPNIITDGSAPTGGLVLGRDGYLYGTTNAGGLNKLGTVYRIKRNGTEALAYSFSGADGSYPLVFDLDLTVDAMGNLYGTTETGGAHNLGVVFKLSPSGNEKVLHSFAGPDGAVPVTAPIFDASGDLFGVTTESIKAPTSAGTIYRIVP